MPNSAHGVNAGVSKTTHATGCAAALMPLASVLAVDAAASGASFVHKNCAAKCTTKSLAHLLCRMCPHHTLPRAAMGLACVPVVTTVTSSIHPRHDDGDDEHCLPMHHHYHHHFRLFWPSSLLVLVVAFLFASVLPFLLLLLSVLASFCC